MERNGRMQTVTASDGHKLDCWIAPARGKARGGLVILQEIFGVTDQLKSVAARYADAGYTAAIPALFDRQKRNTVVPFEDFQAARALMMQAETDKVMADIDAAIGALRPAGKVAVLGFCWGGGLAVRCAQDLDIAAAVSFYGTRLEDYMDRPAKVPLQGHFGLDDSHTPPEVVGKVKAFFPGFDIHMYSAGHAFANDQRPAAYDAEAAATAHDRTLAFLALHLT